jgi:hypothetical protein
MKKVIIGYVIFFFVPYVSASWDQFAGTRTKINYSILNNRSETISSNTLETKLVLRITTTSKKNTKKSNFGVDAFEQQAKEYVPEIKDYPINSKWTVLGPESLHDYSGKPIEFDYILLGRGAILYIDTRQKKDNDLVVYAAQGSRIYDYGSNVTVTDIDLGGQVTYKSNSFYLNHPFLYWGGVIGGLATSLFVLSFFFKSVSPIKVSTKHT